MYCLITLRHGFIQHVFDDVFNNGLTLNGTLVGQVDGLISSLTIVTFLFVL